jgi:hypothetical protein
VHPLGIRKTCCPYSSNRFLEVPITVVIYLQQPARVTATNRSSTLICLALYLLFSSSFVDTTKFLFHPFFARLVYLLLPGAGPVLCFLFDALLVTASLGLESPDKLSGLVAILRRSANQIKPLSHNKKLRKRLQKNVICKQPHMIIKDVIRRISPAAVHKVHAPLQNNKKNQEQFEIEV